MLTIYPEGCTTNGTHLIKFKKGAFASLRAVRPSVMKYQTGGASAAQDIIGFFYHTLLSPLCRYICITQDVLPVFLPNDYFWKHHWN